MLRLYNVDKVELMSVEHWWNDINSVKHKHSERPPLSECHFVHSKSNMEWPVTEPGFPPSKNNCLHFSFYFPVASNKSCVLLIRHCILAVSLRSFSTLLCCELKNKKIVLLPACFQTTRFSLTYGIHNAWCEELL
jgi:hypothetical protein